MAHLAVDVTGLTHHYNTTSTQPILKDLSLTLDKGQTLALIGASGSGKSTLLNIIGGLEPVQQGSVSVFSKPLQSADDAALTQLRRNTIGIVYQSFNLIPTLSVTDNIKLPMALDGVARDEQRTRIEQLLEKIGLDHRSNAFPDALSGGEQQRVAIARAVVHRPALLLADEPTGNLDATTGQQVMHLLQDLVAEHNTTLLMVTHSSTVAGYADRVLTMSDGTLKEHSEHASSANTW